MSFIIFDYYCSFDGENDEWVNDEGKLEELGLIFQVLSGGIENKDFL